MVDTRRLEDEDEDKPSGQMVPDSATERKRPRVASMDGNNESRGNLNEVDVGLNVEKLDEDEANGDPEIDA